MLLLKLLPPCQANICSLRLRNPPFQTILLISLVFFFTHEFDNVASESDGLDISGTGLVR